MSANLEKAIQEELRELTDEQQRQVMAFVETVKPQEVMKTLGALRELSGRIRREAG